jgi:sporulation protein YlmC with PRC-barrel domain
MLRSAKELQGYSIYATDGEAVGDVEAFFFDDESWKVRYLVAKAGGLLVNREVLIAPEFVESVDRDVRTLYTGLTRKQVENSPGVEADRPVADQQEIAYYDHYGVPPYWGNGWEPATGAAGPAYTGAYLPTPGFVLEPEAGETVYERRGDPHLRSTREVAGYHIGATDGETGHVEDFIVDGEDWAIRYVVVDTRNWLPGRKVLVSPRWIPGVSWRRREVYVNLTRDEIKSAPEWDPDAPLDREYETRLYEHYGRPPYWVYHQQDSTEERTQ